MPLTDLVAPNAILPALKVNNKKQTLHELAARVNVDFRMAARIRRYLVSALVKSSKVSS